MRRKKIAFWLFWQCLGVGLTVAISQTTAAIGFPLFIIALIPLRWKILPIWFSSQELAVLDAPTADSAVVLASLGGKPLESENEKGGNQGSEDTLDEISHQDARRRVAQPREAGPEEGGHWREA